MLSTDNTFSWPRFRSNRNEAKYKLHSITFDNPVNEQITSYFSSLQPRFGLAFDVDGVLARGTIALPEAVQMSSMLKDQKGDFQVPTVFVTNALNKDEDKANQISNWLGVTVSWFSQFYIRPIYIWL